MSQIVLRLARLGDAPRIAAMSRTLIEDGLPWSWTPRRVATHMRSREHLTVIAVAGGELAGFVLAQFGSRAVHVALLGVAPAHQRTGLGKQLVSWVEESASVAGLFLMQLEVRARNQPARRFYAGLGYRETTRAVGYYSGVEDAIKLERDLAVTSPKLRQSM
ncbi:MAG TPA: GNAT family N-acetyltransferase [Steroidobacteraceae bacterium]|nr:GNAT family N-acetyltransferase [Steroidobacteraceae bacterium]